jgi:hypothetical protein
MRRLSVRAITFGLIVLVGLYVIFFALFQTGLFTGVNSTVVIVVGALVYVCGGYVAGVTAGHDQVLNAFAVGLLFGASIWFIFRVPAVAALFNESSISADRAGMGVALFAVLACGIGGVVSVVPPFHRRRRS